TGRPPFPTTPVATTREVLRQVRSEEPIPPRRLQPKAPADLETICLKCLRKDPAQRYASAEALADDLQRFLEHKPIQARRATLWGRGVKWARRRPAAAALAAVSAAAALGVAVLVGALWYGAERRAELVAKIAKGEERLGVLEADLGRTEALLNQREA